MAKYRRRTNKPLSAGTLYPFLQNLEAKEIVSSQDKSRGKRPRREFQLTRKGRNAVRQLFWRFASITAAAIESNLQVCASWECKVYEGVHYVGIEGEELAYCCQHCAASCKRHLLEESTSSR